ncbi:MAG TPA: ABC transporter substrate-binding protein [Nevskiaceae bacterium]
MSTRWTRRRTVLSRVAAAVGVAVCALGMTTAAQAAEEPIKIAILAPLSITPGKAIVNGAKMAAEDINAAGGMDGRPVKLTVYDTQLSSTGAINAMKQAVMQNHDVGVVGVFTTEVTLPLMPYAKRLNVPLILQSGSSEPGKMIHEHYDDYKNVFQLQLNSFYIGQEVCDAAHDLFASGGKASAVILSEQADWARPLDKTYQECLPKAGIPVKKLITYAVNTGDYGPVYNQVESLKPSLIITGMAHTGLAPVVQWHQDHVPALMLGFNMQAGTSDFWKASNGAAQGTIVVTNGAGGAAVTSKTPAFYHAYVKKYGQDPMLLAYTTYDGVYALVDAIKKAGTTDTAKVVEALQKTDLEGVTGRIKFYGKDARFAHVLEYGPGLVTGVAFQWQHGKQVVVWPKKIAQGSVEYPDFVPHS